ncbi:MAG TPA: glycosyltransferase family 2 protein [Solirubrobacteraceae bacterium]
MTPDTMALRLSKPHTSPARPGAGTAELAGRARKLLTDGDLAGYRALFGEAARETDLHRRYAVRKELLQAGLAAPRGTIQQIAPVFIAVATEGLAILDEQPSEPLLLNFVGIALYELGALAGAKALFQAAYRLDPELTFVKRNLDEIARRRRDGVVPRLPAAVASALRSLESDAKRTANRARPAEGMTITLSMIVRDEESMLPRCLEAVAEHVDEIVIVDTGSTDRTIEIAREFGAKVIEAEWTGDFAAARNISFEAATSDWIVYLDADEVMGEGQAARLRELTGRVWREAFFLVENNHTGDLEDGTSVHHNALRVFRNRPEYRFEGRIHEQIAHRLPGYLAERIETTDVRMEHFGYLGVVREEKDKSRRNLELLQRQLEENGETPFLHFNLGSEHGALGEAGLALEHFRKAWEGVNADGNVRAFGFAPSLASRLTAALRIAKEIDALERHVEEALVIFPGFTDLVFEAGLAHLHTDNHPRARELFSRCVEMGDAPSVYSATIGCGSYAAFGALGEVERAMGDLDAAEASLRRALAENPRFLGAVEPLAQVLLARDVAAADVAAEIHALAGEDTPALRFLLAVPLYEAGAAEEAERELRAVLARQPHAAPARVALAEAAEVAAQVAPEAPAAPAAAQSELFARLAGGEPPAALDAAFARARDAGLGAEPLALFEAWRALLGGDRPHATLPAGASELLFAIFEALLRVQDVDAFVALLPLADWAPLDARDRRERMAQLYLRRGFADSAADEWAAACEELGPDAAALAGLAAVAFVRGDHEDAALFANAAQDLEPGHAGARRVLERLGL